MVNIQFVGLNKLDSLDKDSVDALTFKYINKIERRFDIASFKVHVKKHEKSGHTSRFEVKIKAVINKKIFEVEKNDFDITKLMHKSFNALTNEIKHYINSKEK